MALPETPEAGDRRPRSTGFKNDRLGGAINSLIAKAKRERKRASRLNTCSRTYGQRACARSSRFARD